MSPNPSGPPFDEFLAAADAVAAVRPDVDLDMAREVFREAAVLLHNGLALDGLDDHDTQAVISGLCIDLAATDPGAAIRARSMSVLSDPDDLHDPEGASAAYLIAAGILQL